MINDKLAQFSFILIILNQNHNNGQNEKSAYSCEGPHQSIVRQIRSVQKLWLNIKIKSLCAGKNTILFWTKSGIIDDNIYRSNFIFKQITRPLQKCLKIRIIFPISRWELCQISKSLVFILQKCTCFRWCAHGKSNSRRKSFCCLYITHIVHFAW